MLEYNKAARAASAALMAEATEAAVTASSQNPVGESARLHNMPQVEEHLIITREQAPLLLAKPGLREAQPKIYAALCAKAAGAIAGTDE